MIVMERQSHYDLYTWTKNMYVTNKYVKQLSNISQLESKANMISNVTTNQHTRLQASMN